MLRKSTLILITLLSSAAAADAAATSMRSQIETDWLRQVDTWVTPTAKPAVKQEPDFVKAIHHFIERGRLLAVDLRKQGIDTAACESGFRDAESQLSGVASADAQKALYLKVRWTFRRLAFRNPLLNFDRILFVKRFCQQTYPDVCLNHMPWVSRPGGDLCILTMSGPENMPEIRAWEAITAAMVDRATMG